MQKINIEFAQTGLFNSLITDYIAQKESVKPFYQYAPSLESFAAIIEQRKNFPNYRNVLTSSLLNQYGELSTVHPLVKDNIDSLNKENTFTVTTGHQLCLFTGPLYVIYKIISTINLAKALKEEYPAYHFVPVYWMASEDHDFKEINHIHLFNKKIVWNFEAEGASGELPTETIADVLKDLKDIIGDTDKAKHIEHVFEKCYLFNANLADATRALMNELFGKHGLVTVDGNDAQLKKIFIPQMEEELVKQSGYEKITSTSKLLESQRYKSQVNPRNINLFFLEEGIRERIVQSPDGDYEVVNTDLKFSKEFLIDLLHKQPERFSPNVIMRPVYQETILPNLAYVGGPGEISYWLQFKSLFDHHTTHYPALIMRSSALLLDAGSYKKMQALGVKEAHLFKPYDELVKNYIATNSNEQSGFADETLQLKTLFDTIINKATVIDQTLSSSIKAEQQKALNSMDVIEKKVSSAIKRKHDNALMQIKSITEKVFPEKVFQERYQNFIPYYLKYGDGFIDELITQLKPFDYSLNILTE